MNFHGAGGKFEEGGIRHEPCDEFATASIRHEAGDVLADLKDEVVAKYSVLAGSRQIFASKYMLYLPTEEQLRREIERERKLIEAAHQESNHR